MPNYLIVFCTDQTFINTMPRVNRQTEIMPSVTYVEYDVGGKLDNAAGIMRIPFKSHFDAIILYGSHGDVDVANSLPRLLNGLSNSEDERFIKKLCSKKVTADLILLDCCLSMTYVSYFYELLTCDGHFVASIPTLIASVMTSKLLPIIQNNSVNFLTAFEKAHQEITCMGANPYGVFIKSSGKLHRCNDKLLQAYAVKFQACATDFTDARGNLKPIKGEMSISSRVRTSERPSFLQDFANTTKRLRNIVEEEITYNNVNDYINGIRADW